MLRSYLTPGPHSPNGPPFIFVPYQWVHGSFDFSKNRWFPVFHPPKKQHQRTAGSGYIKKTGIKEPASLGILKTPESKNPQLSVFQNPKRTASFHERPTGSFQVLWLVNCSRGWFWGQVPQINFFFVFWINSGSEGFMKEGNCQRYTSIYPVWNQKRTGAAWERTAQHRSFLTQIPNPQPPLPS